MKKKSCWIAKRYRKGWKLGFCLGEAKPTYLCFYFKDEATIKEVLKRPVVFVHMRDEAV